MPLTASDAVLLIPFLEVGGATPSTTFIMSKKEIG